MFHTSELLLNSNIKNNNLFSMNIQDKENTIQKKNNSSNSYKSSQRVALGDLSNKDLKSRISSKKNIIENQSNISNNVQQNSTSSNKVKNSNKLDFSNIPTENYHFSHFTLQPTIPGNNIFYNN